MTKTDFIVMILMQTAKEMKLEYVYVNRLIAVLKEKNIEVSEVFERCDELPTVWHNFIELSAKNYDKLKMRTETFLRRKIGIISTENPGYPKNLKQKLREKTPPCFFSVGNTRAALGTAVSITGVRDIFFDDKAFAVRLGELCAAEGLTVVSGGAIGVDSAAIGAALDNGGQAVVYLPQGFEKSFFLSKNKKYLQSGNLLCLSLCFPWESFSGNSALERNVYIHSHGDISVTVRAKYKSGGSWSGACYNLERGKTPAFVSDIPSPGNQALAEMGATVLKREDLFKKNFSLKSKILDGITKTQMSPTSKVVPGISRFQREL